MIQVYTGNGKGKTTAALGLALRAAGAGQKVYIGQFAKARPSGEHKALKLIKNITLECFGRKCFLGAKPQAADRQAARRGMLRAKKAVAGGRYRMVILDELNIVLKFKLLEMEEFLKFLDLVPKNTELVLTGRYAPAQLVRRADLVSRVMEVKHYYRKGVKARKGIEF